MASQHKKTIMKKDIGEKGDKSRPVSAKLSKRESSAKLTNSSNGSLLSKSKQEQILKENVDFKNEIKTLNAKTSELEERLKNITSDVVEHSKSKGYNFSDIDLSLDLKDFPLGKISELLDFLQHGKDPRNKAPLVNRLEELETRVTHLNMELCKMIELRMKMEQGLVDIEHSRNLFDAQNRARFLLYEASKYLKLTCF